MEAVPFLYKIIKIRKIQLSDGCKRSKIAFIGKKVCTVSNNVIQSIEQNKLVRKGKRGILRIVFGRSMVILVLLALQFVLMFMGLYHLFQYLPLLFGGVVTFTGVMLLYVLNTRDNPSVKLSWCIVISILPVFGALLYFFVRFDLGHRVVRRMVEKTVRESAVFLPAQPELLTEVSAEDKNLGNLAHYLKENGNFSVYTNTRVTYFPLGERKFEEMCRQLEQAEKFIFMEYFSIGPGYMWDTLLDILSRKAAQGVEVRVMYDGMCAVANLPYNYPQALKKLGIQSKMFSPVRPMVSTHYNNRDHRKILVIDGRVAFTGGVNLEDRYINRETVYGHWKDTAVMLEGDAAQGFTMLFLQMWNYDEKEPVYVPYLALPQPSVPAPGYVIPYGDTPTDDEHVGEMVYLNILNQAKDYVYIMTPYLILDNEMVTALQFAARRGVDVRLILPHIPDKKYAFALARSHYAELIGAGVRIYEYTPGFVHAKVFLSDDLQAVVGTINLDYRSLYLHFECAAYLYGVPALADIRRDFQQTLEKSQCITMEDVKKLPFFTKLSGKLLKVIAPLM